MRTDIASQAMIKLAQRLKHPNYAMLARQIEASLLKADMDADQVVERVLAKLKRQEED